MMRSKIDRWRRRWRGGIVLVAALDAVHRGRPRTRNPASRPQDRSPPIPGSAQHLDELVALYTHLHTHPELSFQEVETSKRIAEELRRPAPRSRPDVGKLGVVGVLEERRRAGRAGPHRHGRAAGRRGDRPALRQQGQGTRQGRPRGRRDARLRPRHPHDLLRRHGPLAGGPSRPLVGDRRLGRLSRPRRPSTAPAAMLDDGLYSRFPKPDFALALHCRPDEPVGTVSYCSGPALASSTSVDITIRGKGGPRRLAAPHDRPDRAGGARDRRPADDRQPRDRAERAGRRDGRLDPRRHQAQHHPRRGQAAAHAADVQRTGPPAARSRASSAA